MRGFLMIMSIVIDYFHVNNTPIIVNTPINYRLFPTLRYIHFNDICLSKLTLTAVQCLIVFFFIKVNRLFAHTI